MRPLVGAHLHVTNTASTNVRIRLTKTAGCTVSLLLGVVLSLGVTQGKNIAVADVHAVVADGFDMFDMFDAQERRLLQRLRPGVGLSFELQGVDRETIRARLQVIPDGKGQQRVTDPATGLTFRRRRQYLSQLDCFLIESVVSNHGSEPIELRQLSIIDWTFAAGDDPDAWQYEPLTYRNDLWYESTYWSGPDWTRVGKDWHHSGINTPSVRRFVAPRDGNVAISGRVFKADTNQGGGDGVRLTIRHGERDVWQKEIAGNDGQGVEPRIELSVRKGDSIRFVVHRRGSISFDTTHWDPRITYDDGGVFQASTAFSLHRQGHGGWFYEMDVTSGERTKLAAPRVHGFGRQLISRSVSVPLGESAVLPSEQTIPAWVLTDRFDVSGVVLAVPSAGPWQLICRSSVRGQLRLQVKVGANEAIALRLQPGQSMPLPPVLLGAYAGAWLHGVRELDRMLNSESEVVETASLQRAFSQAASDAGIPARANGIPELEFCAMVQADWARQDQLDETAAAHSRASAEHLARAGNLLTDLNRTGGDSLDAKPTLLADEARELGLLATRLQQSDLKMSDLRSLYYQVRWLKRRIALANPRLDFGNLVFCKRVPTSYSHLVMQYYGWRARPGGGLFVLDRPGRSLECRDILAGKLSDGNVLEPRLSYDGKKIVFSFVECREGGFDYKLLNSDTSASDGDISDSDTSDGFYHIWTVNVDGSDLRQISYGAYDDLMPNWLPDGGIVFSSTRRRGYARCFGEQFSRRWHVYTLHRMDRDGANVRCLSAHDTNEWFPVVSNAGQILYSRWDYIDRDAVTHQNLWAMRPDGSNTIAVWGNATSSPHCTFQPQPIPGSGKIVFTASAHHSITGGSIAIIDPTLGDNGQQAITRVTPEVPFPEAEGRDINEYYASPWPLSEKYFLVAYSPVPLVWEPGANDANALGICLLDTFGNRELIYRDPDIGSTNPIPLTSRAQPMSVPSLLTGSDQPQGELTVMNVYEGLGDIPRGTIKSLRVIQVFPKTTPVADLPGVGLAREENARAILGTVPVESDGSARFTVPAGKPLLFQALDERGCAYQTMRTVVYVQPGERTTCIGCHESRAMAPDNHRAMALARPPSEIDPGSLGGRPFSYPEVVQPVLDRYCVQCHGAEKPDANMDLTGAPHAGFSKSYLTLCGDDDFWGPGTNPENARKSLVPRFGGRNQIQVTPPGGLYGARGSRLMRMLQSGHEGVAIDSESLQRLAAWIDCNAIFYGVYRPEDQQRQLSGQYVGMPDVQ